MTKKLFIIPWFGPYPEWLDQWVANMEYLKKFGYDYMIFSSLKLFKQRVRDKLEVEPVIYPGTGKVWDYRPLFGVLFADEIRGYDYWGHTDFDCIYGDVEKFFPKEDFEVWSNHDTYICGPWTLYKNTEKVNNVFRDFNGWQSKLATNESHGWVEKEFTYYINQKVNIVYTLYQNKDFNNMDEINFHDGKLYDGKDEIMMCHFRRTKTYPILRYGV